MKIAIHTNALDDRGLGKTPYDYGLGLRKEGYEVCYITSGQSGNESAPKIAKEFPIHYYQSKIDRAPVEIVRKDIEDIVNAQKVDFVHMLKAGENDHITPSNVKTGIHCVFHMHEPHGNVYAAVSETLARKHSSKVYVPHIIKKYEPTKDIRKELGIPDEALVFGRHGGKDTFDLPFVHQAIEIALQKRKDIYFLFLSTDQFIQHERVVFFPWVSQEVGKFNFINACDVMLHARRMGETFGLAVGEFAICNKPVITWSGMWQNQLVPGYDVAHIDHLQNKAVLYNDGPHLEYILTTLSKDFIKSQHWDTFSAVFNEAAVIQQYKKVFLT